MQGGQTLLLMHMPGLPEGGDGSAQKLREPSGAQLPAMLSSPRNRHTVGAETAGRVPQLLEDSHGNSLLLSSAGALPQFRTLHQQHSAGPTLKRAQHEALAAVPSPAMLLQGGGAGGAGSSGASTGVATLPGTSSAGHRVTFRAAECPSAPSPVSGPTSVGSGPGSLPYVPRHKSGSAGPAPLPPAGHRHKSSPVAGSQAATGEMEVVPAARSLLGTAGSRLGTPKTSGRHSIVMSEGASSSMLPTLNSNVMVAHAATSQGQHTLNIHNGLEHGLGHELSGDDASGAPRLSPGGRGTQGQLQFQLPTQQQQWQPQPSTAASPAQAGSHGGSNSQLPMQHAAVQQQQALVRQATSGNAPQDLSGKLHDPGRNSRMSLTALPSASALLSSLVGGASSVMMPHRRGQTVSASQAGMGPAGMGPAGLGMRGVSAGVSSPSHSMGQHGDLLGLQPASSRSAGGALSQEMVGNAAVGPGNLLIMCGEEDEEEEEEEAKGPGGSAPLPAQLPASAAAARDSSREQALSLGGTAAAGSVRFRVSDQEAASRGSPGAGAGAASDAPVRRKPRAVQSLRNIVERSTSKLRLVLTGHSETADADAGAAAKAAAGLGMVGEEGTGAVGQGPAARAAAQPVASPPTSPRRLLSGRRSLDLVYGGAAAGASAAAAAGPGVNALQRREQQEDCAGGAHPLSADASLSPGRRYISRGAASAGPLRTASHLRTEGGMVDPADPVA